MYFPKAKCNTFYTCHFSSGKKNTFRKDINLFEERRGSESHKSVFFFFLNISYNLCGDILFLIKHPINMPFLNDQKY